jgi:glycosyltransferase involved in cell wall biosynthesis
VRIGIVTGEYPPMQGGVGAFSDILARTLAGQGHGISVFSSAGTSGQDPAIMHTAAVQRWTPSALQAVQRWASEQRLDVIDLQYQTAAYSMSAWIHFLPDVVRDIPVVTTFHDLRFPYLFPKAGRLRDWIVMHLARASDGVIVTNHEDLARVRHLPSVELIPIGSNVTTRLPSDFDSQTWREKAGAAADEFLIAYFGFINRSKGLEPLLDSLAKLRAENVPARLIAIGGRTGTSDPTNAPYADEVERRIQTLSLAPFVHRTGYVDDESVAAYLAAGDAVALPFLDGASYRRGTLMAAIHHGCAIVTTTPAVAVPAFVDEENMLLVPPDDADALALALRRLYEMPTLSAKLRHGASELAHLFDWSQIACDTAAFFERVAR